PFIHEIWDREVAKRYFKERGEVYKIEVIDDIAEEKVSIYKHSDFVDLCKGPHLPSTGQVSFFKLLSTSAAYWKGSEANRQLSRIYGTAFFTQKELSAFLHAREEAKRRDHRILGRNLGLFDIYHDQAGAGIVFYLPKGAVLRRLIEDWEIKEHIKRGYKTVITPHIMNKKLWETSGHLSFYTDYMYPVVKDGQEFILKPMNCPGHILIYKSQLRSWRDLPLRLFELGTVYRYEKSGVLHGLLRVRGFTQDDAHIFCRQEELLAEIEGVLDFVEIAMKKFGFTEFTAELSTRPQEFIGEVKDWDLAESILSEVLKKRGIAFIVNHGDGAFYGPKIDIKLKDALKRSWQCATVQLDYSLPKKFNITYRDQKGGEKEAIMIHRVLLGSIERFIATLTEHYAGDFPLWLAPVQACVVSITKDVQEYALKVKEVLEESDFRAEEDVRDETLQRKIRDRELEKIPYLIIVGKKEEKGKTVSLRKRGGKNLGQMRVEELISLLKEEVSY
ncbi:MAG: threonine--tRNA ligase, partial [Candidatus Omnitrophota bacterium]